MAKKKKKAEKAPREYTRRQLSQWQRQKRRQRIIFYSGISIIAAIILIVVIGWYVGEYRPLHQTVIRVNDTEFDMRYYIDVLKIGGADQPAENVRNLADTAVIEIERNELIRQAALKLGISVSDDEAEERLIGADLPVNDATLDMVRAQLIRNRLYNEYFKPQVTESDKQVLMMAMFLESESQANEIRNRLLNGDNFTALAGELSLDYYSKENKGEIGWHPEDIFTELLGSSVPGEYAFGSEVGVLSQPRYDEGKSKQVGYLLIKVLEKQIEDDAQVQALMLGSEEEAWDIRARLEAGEDLPTLAEEYSQFEESRKQGGELGIVSKGEASQAFEEYVFDPEVEIGVWSEPIRDDTVWTDGGYWLIKVVDKDDDRRLDDDDREFLITEVFNEWLSFLWVDPDNEVEDSYLDAALKQFAVDRVMRD